SPGGDPLSTYLIVPIMTQNKTYGCLSLGNKVGGVEFTADDERLLTMLAAQLAMAYDNSRLFEELKLRAELLEKEAVERRRSAEKYHMVLMKASDGIAIAGEQG